MRMRNLAAVLAWLALTVSAYAGVTSIPSATLYNGVYTGGQPHTIDVTDGRFGAKCDGVSSFDSVTPFYASGTGGTNTITVDASHIPSVGQKIVIAGAGASAAAALATTVTGVSGTTVTLQDNLGTTISKYYTRTVTVSGGSSYAVGDTVNLSDGTVVTVRTIGGGGSLSTAVVTTQSLDNSGPSSVTQTGTSGSGSGGSFTLGWTQTGQYAYASDDGAAINAALTYAATTTNAGPANVTIPLWRVCGTTQQIAMPSGDVSLVGGGIHSSGILALASGLSSVLHRSNVFGYGGGARDLFVQAALLSPIACQIEAGDWQTYARVACNNGTTTNWQYGNGIGSNPAGDNVFNQIVGDYQIAAFGAVSAMPADCFKVVSSGTDATIDGNSEFANCTIGIENPTSGNVYIHPDVFGQGPYAMTYCAEIGNPGVGTRIYDLQCGNAATDMIHIGNGSATVVGAFGQWGNSVVGSAGGVLLDSGTNYTTVIGVNNASGAMAAANVIVQSGTPGVGTNVCANSNATYATCVSATTKIIAIPQASSPYAYTPSAGAKAVYFRLCSAGGGGGGGGRFVASGSGGAGGGGGQCLTTQTYSVADLTGISATYSITVGGGGSVGGAASSDSNPGSDGGIGGNTTITSVTGSKVLYRVYGGCGGKGGASAAGNVGGGGGGVTAICSGGTPSPGGGAGASATAGAVGLNGGGAGGGSGAAGGATTGGNSVTGGPGGPSGGGLNSGVGVTGGPGVLAANNNTPAPAGGTAGNAGTDCTPPSLASMVGTSGGGGGGAGSGQTGGAGGTSCLVAGGAGGGSALNGQSAGAGSAGGDGYAEAIELF